MSLSSVRFGNPLQGASSQVRFGYTYVRGTVGLDANQQLADLKTGQQQLNQTLQKGFQDVVDAIQARRL